MQQACSLALDREFLDLALQVYSTTVSL